MWKIPVDTSTAADAAAWISAATGRFEERY
jgi:hypothetical protein